MFEVGEWEENTERETKLISGLFGTKAFHVDEEVDSVKDSARKKKRKRRKVKEERTVSDVRANENEKQLGNAKEDSSPRSAVVGQNGTIKLEAKKRKLSCSSPKNTDELASTVSTGTTSSKKRRERRKRQKTRIENNRTEDEKLIKKKNKGKKNKKQNFIDAVTADMKDKNCKEVSDTDNVKIMPTKKLELQDKLKSKLESSRFRWINEQLYTRTGDKAVELFKNDESMFDIYHRGFRRQVEQWPVNPVDVIIDWIRTRPKSLVVADFGCGDAAIAQSVPNEVHSFDLVAKNDWVIACNMAKVPLSSGSIDVAIFCLSLMGTDLESFIREAYRVLKPGGTLKIAEVVSRIDVNTFIPSLCQLGFKLDSMDDSNKMFLLMDFTKNHQTEKRKMKVDLSGLSLKPCIYKKR